MGATWLSRGPGTGRDRARTLRRGELGAMREAAPAPPVLSSLCRSPAALPAAPSPEPEPSARACCGPGVPSEPWGLLLPDPAPGLRTLLLSPCGRASGALTLMAFQAPVAAERSPWRPTAWPQERPAGHVEGPRAGPGAAEKAEGPTSHPPATQGLGHRQGASGRRGARSVAGCRIHRQPLPLRTCSAESSGVAGPGTWEKPRGAGFRPTRPDGAGLSPGPPRLWRRGIPDPARRRWSQGPTEICTYSDYFSKTEPIFDLKTFWGAADEAPLCSLSRNGRNPDCVLE